MTELAAEVPSIAKEVFNDLLSRKWYSGIGDFFTYLNENTFTRSLLAANTFLWGAYFTGYTELSAPYVLLTSTALIGTACVATDLVKQLILNIEGAFKTYLCINACIVSLALHIDQNCHPTPFNQLVLNMLIKQQQILGCTLIRWLANGVSILNRWVGNDRIYHLKNRIMEYPAQKTVEIFREKIVKEGDRLKQTAHGKRGKKLIDTAVSFMQDMQQSVEDGLTPNIQSYFSNLVQQFMQLQQLNFQRQMRQAAGTMPQNGPQDAAAAEQDMIRLFQQLQQQLQTGLNHATTTAAQRGEPTDNPIAYLQRMFNEVRAAQLNNQANGAGIDPTNPLNAFWAAFAAAQR